MFQSAKANQRLTQCLLAALTIGVWGLLLAPYLIGGSARAQPQRSARSAEFETLTVQRINVVDPDGTIRLAIGSRTHSPEARYRGRVYERSIDDMIGLVFYEADGDEAGGLVLATLRDSNQTAFIFDYTHQITDGIGLIRRESQDGERWETGFFISDRRPYEPGDVASSQGVERIWLANRDRDASLVIADTEGRARVRIGVDAAGAPRIQMLNAQGEVTFDAGRDNATR